MATAEQALPPFTDAQVASLNGYQASGVFHPFTCGSDSCRGTLAATPDGWRCPRCGDRQQWAWAWMADWSWREAAVGRRFPGWWRLYPIRGSGWVPHSHGAEDRPDPEFPVGAAVRLRGHPERVRRVMAVEWHAIRREFAFVVETSAPVGFRPYWFAGQLAGAAQDAEQHAAAVTAANCS